MTPADRAAKERKQKIFVAVGGLILLALMAIQLPKILGGGSSAAAPAATIDTGGTPTSTPVSLVNPESAPAAGPGQLSSFSEFKGKDPFVQQVTTSPDSSATADTGDAGTAPPADADKTTTPKGFTLGGSSGAAVTVIAVNGARQPLDPGTAFPASDPVFVLVSENPKAKSVVIGIAGGAYASGSKVTKLVAGKPLVLVNTTTGARYKLVLVSVGNGAAPAAPSAASAQASPKTPTTPASTP